MNVGLHRLHEIQDTLNVVVSQEGKQVNINNNKTIKDFQEEIKQLARYLIVTETKNSQNPSHY